MTDVIMANPMGAIAQATQTAGAMDQLSRMRTQDQYQAQDRGIDAQARKQKLLQEAMAFAGKVAPEILSAPTPEEKNARYQQFRAISGLQGFPVEMLPLQYSPEVERRLSLAAANVGRQDTKYGTTAAYFKDPATGKVIAAQGNQAGGFYAGGKPIPSSYEPVAAPNTQYAQEMQNQRFYDKPQIAGQTRAAEAGVDIQARPIIARGEAEARADVEARTKPQIEADVAKAKAEVTAAVEKRIKEQGQMGKLEDADRIYQSLSTADLGQIYGRGESLYPNLMRSQSGIDMVANRNQMVGMLELAAAGEMKGQGQITESERKILKDAATTLNNPDISPDMARASLDRAMAIIYRNAGQKFTPPGKSPAAPQQGGSAPAADDWSDL